MPDWLSGPNVLSLKDLPNTHKNYYTIHYPIINTRSGLILYKGAWMSEAGEGYYNFYNIKNKQYFKIPTLDDRTTNYFSGAFFNNSNKVAFSYVDASIICKSDIYEYNNDFTEFKKVDDFLNIGLRGLPFETHISKDDKTVVIHCNEFNTLYGKNFENNNNGSYKITSSNYNSLKKNSLPITFDDKYMYILHSYGDNNIIRVLEKDTLNPVYSANMPNLKNKIFDVNNRIPVNLKSTSIFFKNNKLYVSSISVERGNPKKQLDLMIFNVIKSDGNGPNRVLITTKEHIENIAIICEYDNKFIVATTKNDNTELYYGVLYENGSKNNLYNSYLSKGNNVPTLTNYSNGVYDNKLYVLIGPFQYEVYDMGYHSLLPKVVNKISNPKIIINKSMIDNNIYLNNSVVNTISSDISNYKININNKGYYLQNKSNNLFNFSEINKYYDKSKNTISFNLLRNSISLSHSITDNGIEIDINKTSPENMIIRYRIKEDNKNFNDWSNVIGNKIVLNYKNISNICNKLTVEVEDIYSSFKGYESNRQLITIDNIDNKLHVFDASGTIIDKDISISITDENLIYKFSIENKLYGSNFTNVTLNPIYNKNQIDSIEVIGNGPMKYGQSRVITVNINKKDSVKSAEFELDLICYEK